MGATVAQGNRDRRGVARVAIALNSITLVRAVTPDYISLFLLALLAFAGLPRPLPAKWRFLAARWLALAATA
jgi:hypothetical protein